MYVRYLIAVCFGFCALADDAISQTAPRPPVARQAAEPNVIQNNPDETWTIPDRNRVNEGTVTVITAPAGSFRGYESFVAQDRTAPLWRIGKSRPVVTPSKS